MKTSPAFSIHQEVRGAVAGGSFCVMGSRWVDRSIAGGPGDGEWLYELREVRDGRHGRALNLPESFLVAA